MIVDLLRNDVGRVARRARVTWADVFEAERFDTVWQLTSTVAAELAPGARPAPTSSGRCSRRGSVTGAPKVATMGIIAGPRGRARGASTAARSGSSRRSGAAGPRAQVQRGDPHGPAGRGDRCGRSTAWAAASPGTRGPPPSTTRSWRRRGCSPPRRPSFRLLETLLHDPVTGYRRLGAAPRAAPRTRPRSSASRSTSDAAASRARTRGSAVPATAPPASGSSLDRRAGIETGPRRIAPAPAEPVRLAIDAEPGRSDRRQPVPQDHAA